MTTEPQTAGADRQPGPYQTTVDHLTGADLGVWVSVDTGYAPSYQGYLTELRVVHHLLADRLLCQAHPNWAEVVRYYVDVACPTAVAGLELQPGSPVTVDPSRPRYVDWLNAGSFMENPCPVCNVRFPAYEGMRGSASYYWCQRCQDAFDSVDPEASRR